MVGGIVLAGGRSSRMGEPKASLEWHGSTLVRRVSGLVERGVEGPVVIVRSVDQELPRLPERYAVVEDVHGGRGPLEGLAAGLRALDGRAELAYVSSTDVPFLHTSFVGAVVGGLGDGEEICVPVVGRGWQPLAAAYRTSVLRVVEELLGVDDLRVSRLFDRCRVTRLDRDALLAVTGVASGDPDLESVVNINDPAAYAAARERPAPAISVRWGRLRDGKPQADGHASTVRAATLGGVADVLEIELDEVNASVNGVAAGIDRELPLERGDAVVFTRMMR